MTNSAHTAKSKGETMKKHNLESKILVVRVASCTRCVFWGSKKKKIKSLESRVYLARHCFRRLSPKVVEKSSNAQLSLG